MSGPWEKFSSQPAAAASAQGPWSKFSEQAAQAPADPKVKREGWTGVLQGGVESAGRAIGSAYDAITGDNASIVERANANQNVEKDAALSAFYSDIEASRQQLGEDAGLVDSIGAVGGAIARNKEGAGKALVEQLPNSAAALGGGWAGMKAGAALGAFAGPVGAGIGGVVGGLAGMFLGNAALEVGNKAMDAAKDGVVTDEERTGAIKDGSVKAAVITGVDAVTLGGSKWLTGVTSRALESATRKTLADAGVDVTSRTAVEAARKSPELSRKVLEAQERVVAATSKLGPKLSRYGAAGALETVGEGVGEYLGELAATGKADMIDSVLESALSAPQSGAEIAWGVSRNEADARSRMWEEAEQQTLALPNKGPATQYVFPDGSTTTDPEAARRFIETLPADQRNAAYEQLLSGKWQKPADPKAELTFPDPNDGRASGEYAGAQDDPSINWIESGPRTMEQRLGQMAEEADRVRASQQKERDLLRLVGESKLTAELDRAEEQDAITRAAGRDVPLEGQMQAAFQGAQQATPSAPTPTAEPSAQDRALAQRLLNTRTSPPPQPPTPTRPDMANEFERARRAAEAQKAAELEQLAAESRVPAAEFDAQRSDRIMEAAGVGDTQPTALQLAMQRAQGAAPAPAQNAPQDIAQLRDADRAMAARLLRTRTGPSGTVPESAADIQSQVRGYAEGKRGPVFVDGDVQATAVPEGMAVVPSQYGGNYIAKSEDAAAIEQIEATTGDKEIARKQILGYVQTKPDAMAGGAPLIVQSRDEQGGIVKQELVDGNDPQAVQAAQQSQTQAGAVEVTTPDAAMAERMSQPKAEQAPAAPQPAPAPKAKRGPVPRGEAKSLLELIRRNGGIAKRLESDIAGEPTVRKKGYPVGVFREGGMREDMLAELMQQHGYLLESDVMGSDSGAELAFELVRSALAGERVVPIAERERLMAEAEEKAYRDGIREAASEAGIKIVGRKFSDLEADVLALRERQQQAKVDALDAEDRALYDEVLQEVRDSGIMEEAEIEALIERNMNAPLRELVQLLEDAYLARIEEINAEAAAARAPRELNEEEYRDAFERENQGEAGGDVARAPRQRDEAGGREADQREAAPDAAAGREGFRLEGQTERELKARIDALEAAEAERKKQEAEAERRAQADAEHGQFMLTGSDRPADVLAAQGQTSIFDAPAQPAPTQTPREPEPITLVSQKRVRDEGGIDGVSTQLKFSDGQVRYVARLNSTESMGVPGWHDAEIINGPSYLGDSKEQAIAELLRRMNQVASRSRESRASTAGDNFRRWFGESRIVDEDGEPMVMYHGTTHPDIEVFVSAGTAESFLGKGPYFTSSAPDASDNYAGIGPDLTSRIEREAEQLANDFHDDDYTAEEILREYFDDVGIDLEAIGIEDVEAALDDLKDEHGEAAIAHAAHKRLKGASDGLMMPVYLKVERPFDMTGDQQLYLEYDTNEDGDLENERGEIVALIEAINLVAGGFDVSQGDIDNFTSWLYENGLDGLSPREIFDHGQRTLQVYADSDGESVSFGQFWQEVLRETGLYDGIVMDADLYFGTQRRGFAGARIPGMSGVTPGTIHVVPFAPEQVKSAIGNSGNFDPGKQSILESRGRSESAAAITNSGSANTDKVRRLLDRARQILGDDARLVKFAEQLLSRADGRPISGRYTSNQLRGIIEVALNSRNPLGALNHEAFHHALEAFFSPAQARIIKMAFAPGGALAAKVKKQLRLDGETAVLADRDYLDGEELSAFGFQYFAAGRLQFGADVGRIFQALGNLVERLRNWFQGAGFNTVEELFEALDQGKLGPQGPKGGRRAPIRESRASSTPSAMAVEAARAKAAQSRAAFRAFDAKAEQVEDADRYFDLVGQAIDDEAALVAALDAMPQQAFGAQANTPDGRMMIVNASAQQPGKWQLTYFGKDGAPWMDVQHTTRAAALEEMVSQAELGTLVAENAQGRESRAGQGRQAQATPGSRQPAPAAAANPGMLARAKQSLKWLDSIMNPLGKMEDQRQYLIQRYKTMGAIAKWEEIGKQIYDTLRKADKADAKATFAYLTTKGATPNGIRNAEVRAKAVEVKRIIDQVGQALVRRGIIPQASYEKYRDGYLPRMYLRYLLDDSINQFATTGAGRKPSSLGYTKARKDLDPEVREVLLGEVTDPAFLSATGIVRAMRDLFLLHWLEQISSNKKWVLPEGVVEWNGQRVTPHWLKSEAEQLRKQADFYDNPDAERKARQIARQMDDAADAAFEALGQSEVNIEDYKQMPDTARYGRLRGLWVRNEVYDDIMGVSGMAPENSNWLASTFGYGGIGTKITQAFKVTKVTLNPASQVRNFVSNMVLIQLSGVPLHRIPALIKKAINEMANGGRHYQIAKKYGITESSFSSQELFRMKKELLDLEERLHGLSPWGKVRKMAGVVVEFAGEKYQKVEELGKVMKIIDGMERQQLSEEDAVLEAQKWLFDYSLVPSWLRYARNAPIGAPFLTFTMKVLPRLMEMATEHPQRLIPWVGMWFGLSMMAAASLGYDEDEMKAARESLPKWAREKTHVAILPFKDEDGRLNYIDLGYHFPWTMWVELAQNVIEGDPKGALQSMGALSGPIPDLLIVARTGIDPFTGQEVWNQAEPESVRWGKTLGYLYNMAVPPWLATNGPLAKLGSDETDKFGNLKATAGQAIGQGLGFPYRKFNPAQSRAQNLQVMQYELGEAERAMRTKLRSMQRATPEERQEAIDMHVEHIRDMAKELQDYAKRSAMPARHASQP